MICKACGSSTRWQPSSSLRHAFVPSRQKRLQACSCNAPKLRKRWTRCGIARTCASRSGGRARCRRCRTLHTLRRHRVQYGSWPSGCDFAMAWSCYAVLTAYWKCCSSLNAGPHLQLQVEDFARSANYLQLCTWCVLQQKRDCFTACRHWRQSGHVTSSARRPWTAWWPHAGARVALSSSVGLTTASESSQV